MKEQKARYPANPHQAHSFHFRFLNQATAVAMLRLDFPS